MPLIARPGPEQGLHSGGHEQCPAIDAHFESAWVPLAYEKAARDLIAALKFRFALPAADLIAAQLSANIPDTLLANSPTVVSVPAHQLRRRKRGFDPVQIIAKKFADRKGLVMSKCLARTDRAHRQARASRSKRLSGGRIKIKVIVSPPRAVILIDDVYTTGATLNACAKALKESGCRSIAAVAYARTL